MLFKVLNIGYQDHIGWGFFVSDIGGDIGDTRRAFILDIIYDEILITKSWFSVRYPNKNGVICMQR